MNRELSVLKIVSTTSEIAKNENGILKTKVLLVNSFDLTSLSYGQHACLQTRSEMSKQSCMELLCKISG